MGRRSRMQNLSHCCAFQRPVDEAEAGRWRSGAVVETKSSRHSSERRVQGIVLCLDCLHLTLSQGTAQINHLHNLLSPSTLVCHVQSIRLPSLLDLNRGGFWLRLGLFHLGFGCLYVGCRRRARCGSGSGSGSGIRARSCHSLFVQRHPKDHQGHGVEDAGVMVSKPKQASSQHAGDPSLTIQPLPILPRFQPVQRQHGTCWSLS